jgi:hypothetical protein
MIRTSPKEPSKGLKRTPLKRKPFKIKPPKVSFISIYKRVDGKRIKTKRVSLVPRPPKKIAFLTKTPPQKRKGLKIKIDPLDSLVSEYVRKKTKGFCERCGKYYGWEKLHACHFHSRRKISVRYDEENLAGCDFGCHSWLDGNPMEKVEFFRNKLGQTAFDLLNSRARITYPKPDKKALTLYYQAKIKELET